MKTIITAIAITLAGIIATSASASHIAYEKGKPIWKYRTDTDEFTDEKLHYAIAEPDANREVDETQIQVGCREVKNGINQIFFYIITDERLQHHDKIRIRFDDDDPETYAVEYGKKRSRDYLYITNPYRFNPSPAVNIIEKMETNTTAKFEIYDQQGDRIILRVNTDGFAGTWEHTYPHCDPKHIEETRERRNWR